MLVYTKIALIMKNKIRSKNGILVMPVRTVGRLRRREDSCFHPWANFIEARRCSPAFASKSKFSFFSCVGDETKCASLGAPSKRPLRRLSVLNDRR